MAAMTRRSSPSAVREAAVLSEFAPRALGGPTQARIQVHALPSPHSSTGFLVTTSPFQFISPSMSMCFSQLQRVNTQQTCSCAPLTQDAKQGHANDIQPSSAVVGARRQQPLTSVAFDERASQGVVMPYSMAGCGASGHVVLSQIHLEAYLARHPDLSAVMLVKGAGKNITDIDVIKSLVVMVNGQPHLIVVRGRDRLSEKKLADLLGVARRRVHLASPLEVIEACGFMPGTVPPLGPLPTIVDKRVISWQGLLYGSGGAPDVEMAISATDLLRHTKAQVKDVVDGQLEDTALGGDTGISAAVSGGRQLPLPWQAGSQAVQLVGVVAAKRRVACVLLFISLVPEDTPAPPQHKAVYLRKLWANPEHTSSSMCSASNTEGRTTSTFHCQDHDISDDGSPGTIADECCEVQLIMGKTLERKLGRDGLISLMDRVKIGSVIRVTGKVQPHPQSVRPTTNKSDGHTDPVKSVTVWDVVCHHVDVLFYDREQLESAIAQAQIDGHDVTTCSQLLQLPTFCLPVLEKAMVAVNQPVNSKPTVNLALLPPEQESVFAEVQGEDPAVQGVQDSAGYSVPDSQNQGDSVGNATELQGALPRDREPMQSSSVHVIQGDGAKVLMKTNKSVGGGEGGALTGRAWKKQQQQLKRQQQQQQQQQRQQKQLLRQQQVMKARAAAAAAWTAVDSQPGAGIVSADVGSENALESKESKVWVVGSPLDIIWVDDLATLAQMRCDIQSQVQRHQQAAATTSLPATNSVGSLLDMLPPPIGLDCEWRPYRQGQTPTPVSVMQVGMRGRAYLLDMLRLAGSAREGEGLESGAMMAVREELGGLMVDILRNPGVTALGFQFKHDLERLTWSYPWLVTYLAPCVNTLLSTTTVSTVPNPAAPTAPSCLGPLLISSKPLPTEPSSHIKHVGDHSRQVHEHDLDHAAGSSDTSALDLGHLELHSANLGQVLKARRLLKESINTFRPVASTSSASLAAAAANSSLTGRAGGSSNFNAGHLLDQVDASASSADSLRDVQYVELLRLARTAWPETFLMKLGQRTGMSLSRLVRQVFGVPLDKGCQTSDWAARPLSLSQMEYASADVMCLVALHDTLLTAREGTRADVKEPGQM